MRQHIARQIRVHPLTLIRWVNNQSRPHAQNISLLVKALPSNFQNSFIELISEDFPLFSSTPQNDKTLGSIESQPPPEFYAQVLRAYAHTPAFLYTRTMYDLILQQALEHLDPTRQGLSLSIVCCVPPSQGTTVRTLRAAVGKATPPWRRDLEQQTVFLGIESLAGAAVTTSRLVWVQSRQESRPGFPVHWIEHEQSAAAYPILRKGKVAGSLVASSVVPNYFTETHWNVVEYYANLAALAFEPEDFFDPKDIILYPLPLYHVQVPLFSNFSRRVSQKVVAAVAQGHPITFDEAQEIVWQEIEEELLQLPQDV